CLPKDLPEHFEVSIEDLKIGDVLRVSDIKYSGEIKILVDPNDVILSVSAPRMEVEEEVVEEEEEFIETEEKEPEVIGEKEKEKEKSREEEK
ncbi:unnamed protein product, partial [marine sediment metagenome]